MQEKTYDYDIKSYSFYDTYYDLINNMPTEQEKKDLSLVIHNYMFKGELPNKKNVSGLVYSIFNSLIRPLTTSKNNSRKKSEFKDDCTDVSNNDLIDESKDDCIDDKGNTTNVVKVIVKDKVLVYFKNKELNNIFLEFLELRKKLRAINSERAINNLIKKLNNYDDSIKYKMIEKSITSSWKDVYELKKDEIDNVPIWFNSEPKNEERTYTDEELKEREAIIGGYYKSE